MLQNFAEIVADARSSRSSKMITNRSVANAAVLAENLFIAAKDNRSDVFILSGELHAPVFEPCIKHALDLFNMNKNIKVILTNPMQELEKSLPANNFFQFVSEQNDQSVRILPCDENEEAPSHFILVPDSNYGAYRVETCHENKKAFASFNDPKGANIIREAFRVLWDASNILPEELQPKQILAKATA